MRKLVANPVKIRIERPDYKKFRVADLGLNITENPDSLNRNTRKSNKPKEYTIMETSYSTGTLHANPVYSPKGNRGFAREHRSKILIFNQTISNEPYTCFSNASVEACLPFSFQMTASIISRIVAKSGKSARDIQTDISTGGSVLEVPDSDFEMILADGKRFGKVINRKRTLEKQLDDAVMECDSKPIQYLACCLLH